MVDKKGIAVLASGRGSDLQSILDAVSSGLIATGEVRIVVSDRPDAPALDRGRRHGAEAVHVAPVAKAEGGRAQNERDVMAAIDAAGGVDLVVLAGYMRLLSPLFVDAYHDRLINIHPALLPAFKGVDGPGDALRYGVKVAGCTTHFVDHEMDAGPVILQGAVLVHPDDDRDALAARILALEHQILPRTVDLFLQDRLTRDGRLVRVADGDTWHGRVDPVPEALYPYGF